MLLEIFPETFNIIARIAKSEWKILLKQIGYESKDTGNATLAVFVGGSLIAILTFACPLQNLTYIIAGSQLFAGVLYSFFFLYSPHRPKSANLKRELREIIEGMKTFDKSNLIISKTLKCTCIFLKKALLE